MVDLVANRLLNGSGEGELGKGVGAGDFAAVEGFGDGEGAD